MAFYTRNASIIGNGLIVPGVSGIYDLNSKFLNPVVAGQAAYTTPGTYSWTCPPGVYSVCAVCIGGGGGGMIYNGGSFSMAGGGGGGLGWRNNITVTPGSIYTVVVGSGGVAGYYSGYSTAGGQSYFSSSGTVRGSGASTSYEFPLLNGNGMTLDQFEQEFIVIIRYKGDPSPITNMNITIA